MKKFLFYLVILFFSGMAPLLSQTQPQARNMEFGLTFSSLDNFGLVFKTGSPKTLLRLSLLALNINSYHNYGQDKDSIDQKMTGMGAGFLIGFEKRIPVVQNFNLCLGSGIGISYYYNKQDDGNYKVTHWSIDPEINFIFGAVYQAGQHFIISFEITPALVYSYGKTTATKNDIETEVTSQNLALRLSNSNAGITIAYRFSK
jgi:hypothetical protein